MNSELAAFEWDEANLMHVLVESPHGVTPDLVEGLGNDEPKLFANQPREGRSGTHLMVAVDPGGRFWSVVLLDLGDDYWRPITGWPSTNSEIRLYREEEP